MVWGNHGLNGLKGVEVVESGLTGGLGFYSAQRKVVLEYPGLEVQDAPP